MSLSRGLIIYDGKPLVPQFLYRDVINVFDAGPLPNPGPTVFYGDFIGDVVIKYVTLVHVSGAAKTLGLNVTLDGNVLTGTRGMVDNTVYYGTVNPRGDNIVWDTDRVLFCSDTTQYAQSFGNISVPVGSAGVDNVRLIVRYDQL